MKNCSSSLKFVHSNVIEIIFLFKHEIDFSGLFVDEASMVSEDIFEDLLSFGVPIIFFGDHIE